MKIAISTDGEYVSAHFGRCPSFTIVDINDGKVVSREVINNPGHHPGFLPQFFNENDVKQIIGITGKVEDTISQILEGTLKGGESLCKPGGGKGYGIEKKECDHGGEE
jgi:hypothetical protein